MAIANCAYEKALGVDGFPLEVIKSSWSFLKEDFMAIIHDFYIKGNLDWGLNPTLICFDTRKG